LSSLFYFFFVVKKQPGLAPILSHKIGPCQQVSAKFFYAVPGAVWYFCHKAGANFITALWSCQAKNKKQQK